MIVVIAGSRCRGVSISKEMHILEEIARYLSQFDTTTTTIITGGASGVDRWAFDVARECGFKAYIINAEWNDKDGRYNKLAGLERNSCLVELADRVGVFWDGYSRGTQDTMKKSEKMEKIIDVIYI